MKTRPTLLSKVRRGDEEGWSKFYSLYREFIYSAARGAGLSNEDSQDVLQDTMVTLQNYITRFVADPSRARFRTWLRRIVRSRIADQHRRKKRSPLDHRCDERPEGDETATSTTNRIPDRNEMELDRLIDGKLEQAILAEARRLAREDVRIEHYQAYDLFLVQDLTAAEVAATLGVNPVTVRVQALRVRRVVDREVARVRRGLERPAQRG